MTSPLPESSDPLEERRSEEWREEVMDETKDEVPEEERSDREPDSSSEDLHRRTAWTDRVSQP